MQSLANGLSNQVFHLAYVLLNPNSFVSFGANALPTVDCLLPTAFRSLLLLKNKISPLITGFRNNTLLGYGCTVINNGSADAVEQRLGGKELFLVLPQPFYKVFDKHRSVGHSCQCTAGHGSSAGHLV